jgi:hypothetical protein
MKADNSTKKINEELCTSYGYFKERTEGSLAKKEKATYARLCCNCYNQRPGMKVDRCSDCSDRQLLPTSLQPATGNQKKQPRRISCEDCGVSIRPLAP